MKLTEKEYYKYLDIHLRLIYYAGKRLNEIAKDTLFDQFMNFPIEDKYPIRNVLYENIGLLDDYIKEESEKLTESDKEIIKGFKHFKKGTFYVVRLTKKIAYFLGDKFVYGVHALSDPFQMFWGDDLPVMIEAVLLPYNGKIIYDGMMSTYPIRMGKGIRTSIKNDFTLSEAKYGVITTLPEEISENELEDSLEKELLAMMKTKSSRAHYWYEIEGILETNPDLISVYIKEWGRINSRKKKKELKSLGIKKQVYALYNDTIITSGNSQKEIEKMIATLITDKEMRESIYYFKM